MAGEPKAKEVLARACASLPEPLLRDLVNGLSAYCREFNDELLKSPGDHIQVAQGKAQASIEIMRTALGSIQFVRDLETNKARNAAVAGKGVIT